MELFNKLKKVISSTILCIRFPFLYPRNKWDGKHHTYLLLNLTSKLRKKALQELIISAKINKSDTKFCNQEYFFDYRVKLDKDAKKLFIKNSIESKEIDISRLLWGDDRFEILGIDVGFGLTGTPNINIQVRPVDSNDNTNYGFSCYRKELIINKWYYFWYTAINWIEDNVLDRIFIFPSYTELDAMDSGWRKAFGIQMCKEIKEELKKHKFLYKYRISQIKEKFGGLRWYDEGVPKNSKVWDIIRKYEEISYRTCIVCGKPATKMSTGWICPYCDDCADPNRKYTEIK